MAGKKYRRMFINVISVGGDSMEKLFTIKEAADELQIDVHEVCKLIKSKELKGIKIGSIKILRSELLKYKEKKGTSE